MAGDQVLIKMSIRPSYFPIISPASSRQIAMKWLFLLFLVREGEVPVPKQQTLLPKPTTLQVIKSMCDRTKALARRSIDFQGQGFDERAPPPRNLSEPCSKMPVGITRTMLCCALAADEDQVCEEDTFIDDFTACGALGSKRVVFSC